MLATLTDRRDFGHDWLLERKFDGERCVARKDGDDLRGRPLLERRARLVEVVRPSAALQLSEVWRDDSQRRFVRACRSGWEGLIAKRAKAPYVAGRSRDWLKLKCMAEQEFVIG